MAKFHCRACGKEGTFVYDPQRYTCPLCESIDVQFAIGIDPLIDAMKRLAGNEGASDLWICGPYP
ncbi:MAG: hypothetical protein QOE39_3851 [Bradyrhizobium sp.]|nr:hypothetical protein [Bradyrhizobium sp.]